LRCHPGWGRHGRSAKSLRNIRRGSALVRGKGLVRATGEPTLRCRVAYVWQTWGSRKMCANSTVAWVGTLGARRVYFGNLLDGFSFRSNRLGGGSAELASAGSHSRAISRASHDQRQRQPHNPNHNRAGDARKGRLRGRGTRRRTAKSQTSPQRK